MFRTIIQFFKSKVGLFIIGVCVGAGVMIAIAVGYAIFAVRDFGEILRPPACRSASHGPERSAWASRGYRSRRARSSLARAEAVAMTCWLFLTGRRRGWDESHSPGAPPAACWPRSAPRCGASVRSQRLQEYGTDRQRFASPRCTARSGRHRST